MTGMSIPDGVVLEGNRFLTIRMREISFRCDCRHARRTPPRYIQTTLPAVPKAPMARSFGQPAPSTRIRRTGPGCPLKPSEASLGPWEIDFPSCAGASVLATRTEREVDDRARTDVRADAWRHPGTGSTTPGGSSRVLTSNWGSSCQRFYR